ncbi:hypothetical protein ACMFMG_011176 [Clarireedia jacksonii]
MSYTYSSGGKGKDQAQSTSWSQWEWDTRGFWISSRTNSNGAIEYQYEYPPNQNQPAAATSFAESSQEYQEENATIQGSSEGSFGGDYATSPNADPQYPTNLQNETIPRSQYPHPSSSNAVPGYQPSYPSSAAGSLVRSSTGYYDGLSYGMQNLNIGAAGSSASHQYGNADTSSNFSPAEVAPRRIRRAPGSADREELDPRYRVIPNGKESHEFWREGRVFMMLWTEPAGRKPQRAGTRNHSHISRIWLGEEAFSEIRRFVVIIDHHGNCSCLAIHTYNGWATLKSNLPDPDNHAIIYTSNAVPEPYSYVDANGDLHSEELSKDPIKVVREQFDAEGELDAKSRINYTKPYTVEKDVRVLNIGLVDNRSLKALRLASPLKQPPQGQAGRRRH